MKIFLLLSICTLLSCDKIANNANCISTKSANCKSNETCDTVTETCVPFTITAVAPLGGPQNAGTEITITGTGFREDAKVQIGDVPATKVTYVSTTELKALTPAPTSRCGGASVQVTNPDATTATKTDAFYYIGVARFDSTKGTSMGTQILAADQLLLADLNGDLHDELILKNKAVFNNLAVYSFSKSNLTYVDSPTHPFGGTNSTSTMYSVGSLYDGKQTIIVLPHSDSGMEAMFFHYSTDAIPKVVSYMTYRLNLAKANDLLLINRIGVGTNGGTEVWAATDLGLFSLMFSTSSLSPPSQILGAPGLSSMQLTRGETSATSGTQIAGTIPGGGLAVVTAKTGGATYTPLSSLPFKKIRTADFNKDDVADIVGSIAGDSITFAASLSQANGPYAPPAEVPQVTASSPNFEVAALSCDGSKGLVYLSSPRTLSYLPSLPNGTFSTPSVLWTSTGVNTSTDIAQFAVKDITGDGRPDIVYVTTAGTLGVVPNVM